MANTSSMSQADLAGQTVTKTDHVKKYVILIHDDDDHNFDYVVDMIHKVFGYVIERCVALAAQVNNDGFSMVWIGTQELGELKCQQIKNAVPDYDEHNQPIKYPIKVTLEPES